MKSPWANHLWIICQKRITTRVQVKSGFVISHERVNATRSRPIRLQLLVHLITAKPFCPERLRQRILLQTGIT